MHRGERTAAIIKRGEMNFRRSLIHRPPYRNPLIICQNYDEIPSINFCLLIFLLFLSLGSTFDGLSEFAFLDFPSSRHFFELIFSSFFSVNFSPQSHVRTSYKIILYVYTNSNVNINLLCTQNTQIFIVFQHFSSNINII